LNINDTNQRYTDQDYDYGKYLFQLWQDGGKIRVNKNIEPIFKNGGIRLLCIIFNTRLRS